MIFNQHFLINFSHFSYGFFLQLLAMCHFRCHYRCRFILFFSVKRYLEIDSNGIDGVIVINTMVREIFSIVLCLKMFLLRFPLIVTPMHELCKVTTFSDKK